MDKTNKKIMVQKDEIQFIKEKNKEGQEKITN